jgi:mevalonate kinase
MRVTASAPGKLILCGEHAVVYRRPALVSAVDLRLTARLEGGGEAGRRSLEAPVRLRVPSLGLDEETSWRQVYAYAAASQRRWEEWSEGRSGDAFASVRGDDPGHLLKVALGETARWLGETEEGEAQRVAGAEQIGKGKSPEVAEAGGPLLNLDVESELPHGCGFGSSAAAAVAVVAGYLRFRGAEVDRGVVEALALEAERRQHGAPSGVDGAAVLHGGLLWSERNAAGELAFSPFAPRSPILERIAVYDTGRPAEGTGAVVAEVRRRVAAEPARYEAQWDAIEAATRAFRTLLEGGADAVETAIAILRRCQRALEAIGVVPEPVRELVARVEAAGGAAKVSGAGSLAGPGAGTLLVLHRDPRVLDDLAPLAVLRRFPVTLGGPGLLVEAS